MKNIVLTGFMGSGKTTIGRLIAEKLKIDLVDTDSEIIKEFGLTIDQIFEIHGEKKFRECEKRVIERVSKLENVVISTGGGVVLDPENVRLLRKNGVIYFLYASPESILKRLKDDNTRPLLKNGDKLSNIIRLMNLRMPFYKNCDFEINTDILSPDLVAEKIISIHMAKESWK
ncbi:shikimate kinase [Caldicellulosiruptor naganoensis]|uniref:Shikimate kinase n=1 Tax=Caldicellulosiruptor naganoensis TaxID=29324 RepID=A0ABY7BM48_9FIRM|nr:shikimate kinase [Caldicellulosiruptor naganoensis]WAM32469.1 shikimate kinase [Caldicellulosiruptor naganoensis]